MTVAPPRLDALDEPTRDVSRGWVAMFVLANFGVFIPQQAPTIFLMPQQIAEIDSAGKVGAFAWVSAMGAVSGIVL
ncbi:MFS transporter, partial [Spirillospora sp. NPDC049652]